MADPTSNDRCATCYGSGELVTDQGALVCPDCFGDGKSVGRGAKVDWRLRELERLYGEGTREADADVKWLLHELRTCREALVRILTLCHDAAAGDELAKEIKFLTNDALGVYVKETR
jgi:hypothetical protein